VTDQSGATPEPDHQPAAKQPAAKHAWLKPAPDKVTSWDFRILYQAQN
jgi:hypothetical protein